MNPLNYASLEASKRLVDNGIALETEAHHIKYGTEWELKPRHSFDAVYGIPAPSMSEVWRELPIGSLITKCRNGEITHLSGFGEYSIANVNPTDALIDLLVRMRKEEKDERTCL